MAGTMSIPSSVRRGRGSRHTTILRTPGCSFARVRRPLRRLRVTVEVAFASIAIRMSPITKSTSMPLGWLE